MKRILFLLILLPTLGYGQGISVPSANPTTTAIIKGGFVVDSIQVLPLRDTVWPAWYPTNLRKIGGIVIRSADSLPYFYTGAIWTGFGTGGGGGADSSTFATQYQVDTAKANIYAAISGGSADSSLFATIYRTDTMSDNLYALVATKVKYSDTAAMLANYLRESDTTAMLSVYLRKVDTATLSTRIDARVQYTDSNTVYVTQYGADTARATLDAEIAFRLLISDTSAMLAPYLRSIDTTAMLANYAHSNGDNATGTWPISITGNSATVTTNANLTGDVTSSGNATTLATVNANVGSFGSSTSIPSFTVNAKGLITAASGNAVIAPAGTLTGNTLNSTVVTTSITSTGTLTGGSLGTGYVIGRPTMTLGSDANDDIYYRSGGVLTRLAIGAGGTVLTSLGPGLGWAAPTTVTSGTYTPTLSNTTNVAASTARQCTYMRVGNMVTVSGQCDIDPTSGSSTETTLGVSLPIASNFTTVYQAGGTAVCVFNTGTPTTMAGYVQANSTTDVVEIRFLAVDLNNRSFRFIFSYEVL